MQDTKPSTADAYRQYRLRKKLSILELADLSGVHARTIRRIEDGDHERPQIRTVRALAEALEVSFDELLPEDTR